MPRILCSLKADARGETAAPCVEAEAAQQQFDAAWKYANVTLAASAY
jgi:hypothetical protein